MAGWKCDEERSVHVRGVYYVYVLKNRVKDEIYVGSTNDLRRRLFEHNEGKEVSTKRYRPWGLLYYEAYTTEELARVRESRLKHNGNAIRELKKRIGLVLERSMMGFTQHHFSALKSGAGFTFIEALVTVTILLVLGSIAVRGLVVARDRTAVRQATEEVAGFLRETAALATNRVIAPGCTSASDPAVCAEYDVLVTAGGTRYERQARGGGNVTVRDLHQQVRFGATSTVTFQYAPPLLAVAGSPVVIQHVNDSTVRRCVRVLSTGAVEVFGPDAAAGC